MGGLGAPTQTRCKIMDYMRREEPKWHPKGEFLKKPMQLNDLAEELKNLKLGAFEEGDRVQTIQKKSKRKRGQWGTITNIIQEKKFQVNWDCGQANFSNCKIIAYERKARRRLSPCEKMLRDHRLA